MSGYACYNCGEEGHMSRDCPKEQKAEEPKADTWEKWEKPKGADTCYNCGETGHFSRDCPKAAAKEAAPKEQPKEQPPRTGVSGYAAADGERIIPGYFPDPEVKKAGKKKKKNKKSAESKAEEVAESKPEPVVEAAPASPEPVVAAPAAEPLDPKEEAAKQLKRVNKKLNEIERLMAKAVLEPEQQKKVATKAGLDAEQRYLESIIRGEVDPTKKAKPKAQTKSQKTKVAEWTPPSASNVLKASTSPKHASAAPAPAPVAAASLAPERKKKAEKKAAPKDEKAAVKQLSAEDIAANEKRARNVKKILKQIEELKAKKDLSDDQKIKVGRESELTKELFALEESVRAS